MMRNMFFGAVGAVALLSMGAGTAQATSFDLLYQASAGCTAGSASCSVDVGDTIVFDVVISQNTSNTSRSTSVGLDTSAMGILASAAVATSFNPPVGGTALTLNGNVTPTVGTTAALADITDTACNTALTGCDARFTSFGYLNFVNVNNGTWTAGTITIDLTGATPGTYTIATYQRTGVDAPADNTANPHNDLVVTINAIPEPGTASLLGLGLLGLVMAGRRTRS